MRYALFVLCASLVSVVAADEPVARNHLDVKSQKHEVRKDGRAERHEIHRRYKAKKLDSRARALRAEGGSK